jgi:hypothetical protein
MSRGRFFSILITFSFLLIFTDCGSDRGAKIAEATPDEYRTIAKEFINELSGVLVKTLKNGNALSAVSVCSDTAQTLTKEFSKKKGVIIKRVSFKNRNKYNVPDEFETNVLNEFEKMRLQGRLRHEIDYFEIVQRDGKSLARYMKPITVQPLCLTCHGKEAEMDAGILSVISNKYENDLAKDYEVGDLRGAVSIIKVLD